MTVPRKSVYDRIARFYDLLTGAAEDPARFAGLNLLAASAGDHILEIGCGTGRLLPDLARAVGPLGRIQAVDISEAMLRVARKRVRHSCADNVTILQADARHLPFTDGSFDGLYASFFLELLDKPDVQQVLAECRRVLRPDGRLVVVASSREDPAPLTQRLYEWAHSHFPHAVDCRPIHVSRELEACGFQVEQEQLRTLPIPLRIVRAH